MIFPCVGFVRGLLMSDDELKIVGFLLGRFYTMPPEVVGPVAPEGDMFVVLKGHLDDGSDIRRRMLDVGFCEGRLCLVFFGFCDDFKVVNDLGLSQYGASSFGFMPDGRGSVLVECVVRVQVDLWGVVDFDGLRDVVVGGLEASEGCVFPDVRWLAVLRDRLVGFGVCV